MYQFDGRVRFSEVDENGYLPIGGMVDYFQDCSTLESEDNGRGVAFNQGRHLAWILSSWQIVVDRSPRLGEQIVTATWPYDFVGILGLRNYQMKDGEGNSLARANSVWVLFDVERQKPVKLEDDERASYELSEKLEMDYAPRKIALPKTAKVLKKEAPFVVTRTHLDTNRHMNNGKYIHMAMDCLPESFEIGQMRAEYRMQARLGDVIIPVHYEVETENKAGENGKVYMIALENEDGKPYALVEFTGRV